MSEPKSTARVTRLDRILVQSPPHAASRTGDVDPGQVHLDSVPLERIRALTLELEERSACAQDDIDLITMRLLLNDYKAAVTHLRAVTNGTDARLHAAAGEVHDIQKTIRREQEMAAKRAAQGPGVG
jgi:hypothetical protein